MEQQFLNSLYFKSIILNYGNDEIINMLNHKDIDNPLDKFMTLFNDTVEVDPSFLALDESIVDKIKYVINYYRSSETNKNEETINKMNEIIIFCNEISSFTEEEKDLIYFDYIKKQSFQRRKLIFFQNNLFEAIGMDAIVYDAVKKNRVDDPIVKNNIVSTTNYLLHNYFPLVLDEDYYKNLKNILTSKNILSRKERNRGKRILKTMKRIDNII